MSGRRILITGAGGFVGHALTRGFADLGWHVLALDRAFEGGASDPRIEKLRIEIEDRMPDGIEPVDVVVHGAWITTDPETLGLTPEVYHLRNMGPVIAALRFALEKPPRAFVALSSSGVFASTDAPEGLSDRDEPTGDSPYARAKRSAEVEVLSRVAEGGTALHVVRLGYLFGPGERGSLTRVRTSLVDRWRRAARTGLPLEVREDDPARDWTYAPDLAAALERVIDGRPAMRPIHLGSPYVHRDSEIAALIAAAVPGARIVRVPGEGRVKAPMIPSGIAGLMDFAWTSVADGLERMAAEEGQLAGRASDKVSRS
jgi:UDP-glucose 4-epimerase